METGTQAMTRGPETIRRPSFLKRVLYWILDLDDEDFMEEGHRRMRNSPGFFASLTPEQMEYLRNYDGPEYLGPPLTKRNRRFLLQERP